MLDGFLKFGFGVAVGTVTAIVVGSELRRRLDSPEHQTVKTAQRQLQLALDEDEGQSEDSKEIYQEQLVRNYQFFGDSQQDIMRSAVVVVGCGGVGSHCAIALARSGVGYIRLIDFDRVTVSSLNRHGCATLRDVGRTKVECIKRYIASFNSHVIVDAREVLFEAETADSTMDGNIDFVVDCIDHLPAKIGLIQWCKNQCIPVVSSCGAGAKADPSRIHLTDIQHTKECRLASRLRDGLKKQGIYDGVTMCYSSERTTRGLLPLKEHQTPETARQYAAFPEFRVRTVPVIAPLPAIMGNACASFVLCELAGQPFMATERDPLRKKTYRRFFDALRKVDKERELLPLPQTDLLYTMVYHAHSCVSLVQTGLQFAPWLMDCYDESNWVPFSSIEGQRHVVEGGSVEKNLALYGAEAVAKVEDLIEEARKKLAQEVTKQTRAQTATTY